MRILKEIFLYLLIIGIIFFIWTYFSPSKKESVIKKDTFIEKTESKKTNRKNVKSNSRYVNKKSTRKNVKSNCRRVNKKLRRPKKDYSWTIGVFERGV